MSNCKYVATLADTTQKPSATDGQLLVDGHMVARKHFDVSKDSVDLFS